MKQEFLNGQIILHNADCVDIMQGIGDKEIDLILTIDKFLQRLYYLK